MKSLRVSGSVREFVIDQLAGLEALRARPMFGGVGLYAGDVFFGIVAADVLYLKVDDSTRAKYEAAGSTPFKPYADRPMSTSYYSVPVEVLESAPTLVEWARRAVAAARSSRKPGAGRKPEAGSRKPTSADRPAKRR
jgi:DNA transformation protein